MFFNRKKKSNRPLGITLNIELSSRSLEYISKHSVPPTMEDSDSWDPYNSTIISMRIVVINVVDNNIIYISGPDSRLHSNENFDMKLPFPLGQNKTETIEFSGTEEAFFLSFDEIPVMSMPTQYMVTMLSGEPLVDSGVSSKDRSGVTSEALFDVISPKGECQLPVVSTVARDWFLHKNSAARVHVVPVLSDDAFPMDLGTVTQ